MCVGGRVGGVGVGVGGLSHYHSEDILADPHNVRGLLEGSVLGAGFRSGVRGQGGCHGQGQTRSVKTSGWRISVDPPSPAGWCSELQEETNS